MPRRRPRHDDHSENHERWLVSYADFITLLFAFFVVMYSLSSVNEGKYRVLSDSLLSAFRSVAVSLPAEQPVIVPLVAAPKPRSPASRPDAASGASGQGEQVEHIQRMSESIRRALEPLTRTGQVNISEGAHGITVEVNASLLFPAGDTALQPAAQAPLRAIAEVFSAGDYPVTIEGHTDSSPINTARFPSNWELSSVRASSIVRLFADAGVAPSRLSAIGYADQRPIAENLSEEGRARNRRVTIRLDAMYNDPPPQAPGGIRADDPLRTLLP